MDQKSEKALCPNEPREIKIGKTTYIVTASYADKMTLLEKLLRIMNEDMKKDMKAKGRASRPSDT